MCAPTHMLTRTKKMTMVKEKEVMSFRNVSGMGGVGEKVYGNNVTMGLMKEILKKIEKIHLFKSI